MSAYLDTGSVLIESACNVERIAAMLYTLAPFIPDFKYFRWAAPRQLCYCAALCCAVLFCAMLRHACRSGLQCSVPACMPHDDAMFDCK